MDSLKSSRPTTSLPVFRRAGARSVRVVDQTTHGVRRLWLYGSGMLVPLLYFAWRYPLLPNSHTRTDLGKLAAYGRGEFLAFVAGMAILFGFYVLALDQARRLPLRSALPALFTCAAVFAVPMLLMYPVNATDVFHYAVRSRLLTTYGANPLVALAGEYPDDAWRPLASSQWAAVVSPYGPLWNLIAAPITYLSGDRFLLALLGFKLVSALSVLGTGWAIMRSLAATEKAATGVLLFLWNPLVLWEGIGNAHNDVVMVLPLMLALLAWSTRRDALVIPLLVAAATIKYVPILLIPLAAIACWRRAATWPARVRLAGWSIAWSAVVLLVAFFPFYDFEAVQDSLRHQGNILRMSPASVAFTQLQPHFPGVDLKTRLRLAGTVILLGFLAIQACMVWRRPSHLPRAMLEVLGVFLIASTWYFNAWYLIWLVALAALLPWGWASRRMVVWTASGLTGYGWLIWIQAWWHIGFATNQAQAVTLMFGPALLCMLAEPIAHLAHIRRKGSRTIGAPAHPRNAAQMRSRR